MTSKEKLINLIADAGKLIERKVESSDPDFIKWRTKTGRFLKKQYGEESDEFQKFSHKPFSSLVYGSWIDNDALDRECCVQDLKTVKAEFEAYLDEFDENEYSESPYSIEKGDSLSGFNKVFIVHGHDSELKITVARLIEKMGLEAVILSEKANMGKTIIEKFEQNSDVNGAICLFTADDEMNFDKDKSSKMRARQNVVFEAGYFMGKLGREKVIILADRDVEMPSDLEGIVYTDTSDWKFNVLKELKAIGYTIDLNVAF